MAASDTRTPRPEPRGQQSKQSFHETESGCREAVTSPLCSHVFEFGHKSFWASKSPSTSYNKYYCPLRVLLLTPTLSRCEHGTGSWYYYNRRVLCLCLTSSLFPCAHPLHLQDLRPVDGITEFDRSVRQHLASCLALARRATATCSSSMPVCSRYRANTTLLRH